VSEVEPTVRPNGKVYRPRRPLRSAPYDDHDFQHGVIVLGTHDIELARAAAVRAGCECGEPKFDKGSPGWLRQGYQHGEPWWINDDVRGAAAVTFGCYS
jgi:hypothetical protein